MASSGRYQLSRTRSATAVAAGTPRPVVLPSLGAARGGGRGGAALGGAPRGGAGGTGGSTGGEPLRLPISVSSSARELLHYIRRLSVPLGMPLTMMAI